MALTAGKHVMLSYQWDSKALVSKVYKILMDNDIEVWMDVNGGMGDNVNVSMAEGEEKADVVCCFMTPGYQKSYNCQRELEYANKLARKKGLRIIPCMVGDKEDTKWEPSGWLGFITAGLNYVSFRDDSDSKIQLQTTELIHRIKNQTLAPTVESIPTPIKSFESIRQKYLQEGKIKRIVNQEKSFPIEQSYINLAIIESKEQQEKEKKLAQQSQEKKPEQEKEQDHILSHHNKILGTFEEIYESKTTIDVETIFQKCKNQTNKVLVLGRAGIGKSTFCQYATYQWAKDKLWSEYKLLILLHLRNLTDSNYPSGKKYLPIDLVKEEYFQFSDLSKEEMSLFKEYYDKGQILWILDGYDEFAQNIPEQLKKVFDHTRETQHHILTSRPYAITLPYDVKMEITGFTNDNIAKYVEQFFDQIKDEIANASSECQNLLNFLKSNPSIWGVAHIPVNLELICSLWVDTDWSKTKNLTITALYDNITEWLCRRHLTRQKTNHEEMTKQAVYRKCNKELQFLEHLAFKAMGCNKIILPPELLEETENETECFFDDHPQLLNMGILKSYDDNPIGHQNQTQKQHYFVHLSFQEHFAARHLLKTLKGTTHKNAIDFINNNKYNQRFQLVFIFASGLLAQSHYKSCMEAFWTTIQGEPLDLIGIKHIKLIIECIDELGDQTIFPERVHYLKCISQWLDACVREKALAITDNLLQSLRRINSLLNKPLIQSKLIQLMTTSHAVSKQNAYFLISRLNLPEPTAKFLSTIHDALRDEDLDIRQAASEALVRIGEKAATHEVIAGLLNALGDEDFGVRWRVSEALVKMGEKAATNEVITGLLNALRAESSFVRLSAREALVKMGEKVATNEVIAGLFDALRDGNSYVRNTATIALINMGEKAATNEMIAGLLNGLRDSDSYVRRAASVVLGNMGEKAATNDVITGLLNALRDEDSDVRRRAIEALGKMGEKAATDEMTAGLLNALRDEDSSVRRTAIEALGKMGEKAATNEVTAGFLNALRDGDSYVRQAVSEALVKIGEKAATNEVFAGLLNALRDEDSGVRRTAIEAVGKMGEKAATNEMIAGLLNALQAEGSFVRLSAREALVKMGEKVATTEVIAGLFDALRDGNSYVRRTASVALINMGEKAATNEMIAGLLNGLRDSDSYVRRAASVVLGNMGEKAATNEVITGLLNALRDEDSGVRTTASVALGKMGEKVATNEVIGGLLDALRDDDSYVQRAVSEALVKMGEKAATNDVITGLLNALRDEDSSVRRTAIEALGKMGEKVATNEVIAGFLNALRDGDSCVRQAVSEALVKMGEKAATNEVIAGLLNALRDEDSYVRKAASEALVKVGEKAATNEMIAGLLNALRDEDAGVRRTAIEALGTMSEKAATNEMIAGLLNALRDEDSDVRRTAIEALEKMGEKAATNEVIAGLLNALRDEDSDVRRTAIEALGKMGEKAATNAVIAGLLNALGDENLFVRRKATIALGKMGEKAATNEVIGGLLDALRDDDSYVQTAASEALGKMGEKAATNEMIAGLLNALRDSDSYVRMTASVVLGNMGEKAATNDVITGLLNALWDERADIRRTASEALVTIGERARTTVMIVSLLKELIEKIDAGVSDEVTYVLESALCSYRALKELDASMVCKLYSCMKQCHNLKLTKVAPDELIKVFFETGNDAWLPLIRYAALVQGIAVTMVKNGIRVHDVKGVRNIDVGLPELIEAFKKGISSEERKLGCYYISVSGSEEVTTQ